MTLSGWGAGAFGTSPWGTGIANVLQLERALAIRENVVRLFFNVPIKYTGILDPNDAASSERYVFVPDLDSIGYDNEPPRLVLAAHADLVTEEGTGGTQIDVTTDRPLSPFPSIYTIAVNGLVTSSGGLLDPSSASVTFDGLHKGLPPPLPDEAAAGRDIAKPQTREALFDPLPVTTVDTILGTYPTDDTGDYAFDKGLASYLKRVRRRLMTRKNAFGHLPGYGVTIPDSVKHLARPGTVQTIASDAEEQIEREPETIEARVQVVPGSVPGLFFYRLRIRTTFNKDVNDQVPVPFAPTGV